MLMLDFVGNSGKHKLVSSADILGGNVSDEVIEIAHQKAAAAGRAGKSVDMKEAIEESEQELHERLEKRRQQQIKDALNRSKVIGEAKYNTKKISPFDLFDMVPPRVPGYQKGKKPTQRQRNALRNLKVDEATIDKLGLVEAGAMLDMLVKRIKDKKCSYGQAKLLHRFGYSSDIGFQEASNLIDKIAKNGWRPLT